MKKTLLTAAFAVQALLGAAQTVSTPAAAPRSTGTFSAGKQDTMRALGNMYERRRKAGKIWLGVGLGGGLAALRAATASSTTTNSSPYGAPVQRDNSGVAAVVGIIFGGIPLVVGITNMSGASQADQDKVVDVYAHGGQVPTSVARRLHRKDFD